jgi:hypothetical protein
MKPGKLDLPIIWRGCDWPRVVLKWKDANGQPFDLGGWSPKATTTSGYDLRASITDPVNGITQMFLTHTDTAEFDLGTQSWDWIWESFDNPQVPYRYPPFLQGSVTIKEPVTGGPPPPPAPERPPNDDFANAILITGNTGQLSGTCIGATRESGEPDGANTVWYKLTTGADKDAEFYIDSSFLNIDVYRQVQPNDGVADLELVTNSQTVPPNPSRVTFHAFAGRVYYIRLRKRSVAADFVLVWVLHVPQPPAPPSNDNFANAINILHPSGSLVGTTISATTETGEDPGLSSVWYRWVASDDVTMTVALNSNVNQFTIYRGLSLPGLFHVVDSTGTPQSASFSAQSGLTYYFRVYRNSNVSQFTLSWSVQVALPIPPPHNDNFAAAQHIIHPGGTLEGSTISATTEPGEPLPAATNTVWYYWVATDTGTMTFSLNNNNSRFTIYRGLTIGGLFNVVDSSGTPQSASFTPQVGLTYYVRVSRNSVTSNFTLTWSIA